jgi:inorganic pyrophosphatase
MRNLLGRTVKVKMDRPLGSKHPDYELIYPVNYGYIEGTVSGDGEEIDAYVLGEFEPLSEFEGVVVGIIERSNDVEDKLVVAKKLNSYSKEQIKALTEFQERYFESEIVTFDYLKPSIRNTVKALVKLDEKILVLEEIYGDKVYYHLPGGGIEYLEESEEALAREVNEEIGCGIKSYSFNRALSNIFELDGMKAHEIVQVYNVELDIDVKGLEGKVMSADITNSIFKLIDPIEFKSGRKLFYPNKLVETL